MKHYLKMFQSIKVPVMDELPINIIVNMLNYKEFII